LIEISASLLSGEYDAREALISINAQAGGADAADFAENLMRMYLRWAERHKYPTEVYDTSYAEEAGIKSTTFAVNAPSLKTGRQKRLVVDIGTLSPVSSSA